MTSLPLPAAALIAREEIDRATSRAGEGRCEEAVGVLAIAYRSDEIGADDAALLAQCFIAVGRYARATALLEELGERHPGRPDLPLYLGVARFHAGDLEGARVALAKAERTAPGRAETHLYRGILLLNDGQFAAAIEAFDRARALDSAAVEPIASYYAGLAWRQLGRDDRMRASAATVRARAPETEWADATGRWEIPHRDAPRGRRAVISAQWGLEHDDNVLLRAVDPPRSSSVSRESDDRAVWSLSGGFDLFRAGSLSSGIVLGYAGSRHDDLEFFDVHYPRVGLWLRHVLDERRALRFQYDGSHALADGRSVRTSHGLSGSYLRAWEAAGATHAFLRGYHHEYHNVRTVDVPDGPGSAFAPCTAGNQLVCGPPGVDEAQDRDPDGFGGLLGFEHRYTVERLRTQLSGGYAYQYYHARGHENRYHGHQAKVSLSTALPWSLRTSVSVGYLFRDYRTPSSMPKPDSIQVNRQYQVHGSDRHDAVLNAQIEVARSIREWGQLAARWSWLDQDSNVASFDFDRSVVGVYFKARFSNR